MHGSLGLARLRIRSLPPDLTVEGDLDLRQCQRLRKLGDRLRVNGDLLIGGAFTLLTKSAKRLSALMAREEATESRDRHVPLAALPEGLVVGGNLELRACVRLQRFPEQFLLGDWLLINGCRALEALPSGLQVNGDLTICGCPALRELPAKLHVGRHFRLTGIGVDRLPDDLRVQGHWRLECCSRLGSLPDGLKEVGGNLTVRCCPVERLPEDLRVVGNVALVKAPKLKAIPNGLQVGGDLVVRDCPALESLPEGLRVPGTLDLRGCRALARLPSGLRAGFGRSGLFYRGLQLSDCTSLRSLPADMNVVGPIDVAGSGIQGVPPSLEATARFLWRGVQVPAKVVFRPESLAPERILAEPNAELRRVMLERVGLQNVLQRANARVVDRDTDSGGERQLIETPMWHRHMGLAIDGGGLTARSETCRYLICRCPSRGRQYLLRVPPRIATCREAAAWLAGFDAPDQYQPIRET